MLQQKYSRRRPGTVVHAENPRRLEDFKLRPMPDPVSKKKKKSLLVVIPAIWETEIGKIVV
jgi:hypothetical protein